jgi:hypothetical protein
MSLLPGIRTAMKAADEAIGASVEQALAAADEFIEEIPLKGLSPERMHAIEEKGVLLCKQRLASIEAEISRLEGEKSNTAAIIAAGTAKLNLLELHLRGMPLTDRAGEDERPARAAPWNVPTAWRQ